MPDQIATAVQRKPTSFSLLPLFSSSYGPFLDLILIDRSGFSKLPSPRFLRLFWAFAISPGGALAS
jgi:hypothetical protein